MNIFIHFLSNPFLYMNIFSKVFFFFYRIRIMLYAEFYNLLLKEKYLT